MSFKWYINVSNSQYRRREGLANSQLYTPKICKVDLIQDNMRGNHLRYDDLLTESRIKWLWKKCIVHEWRDRWQSRVVQSKCTERVPSDSWTILKEHFPSFSVSSGKCLSSQDQKNGWFKRLLSGNYSNFSPADYVMVSLNVSFHSPPRPQVHALILAKKESKIRAVWSFRRNVGPQLAYVQLSMADSCRALNSLEKYLTKRESTELN